jgi:hypothetical protein
MNGAIALPGFCKPQSIVFLRCGAVMLHAAARFVVSWCLHHFFGGSSLEKSGITHVHKAKRRHRMARSVARPVVFGKESPQPGCGGKFCKLARESRKPYHMLSRR